MQNDVQLVARMHYVSVIMSGLSKGDETHRSPLAHFSVHSHVVKLCSLSVSPSQWLN